MKALVRHEFGMPDNLKFGELPKPEIGPNQVLIEVNACGVNFPDTLIIRDLYQFKPELPLLQAAK